MELQYFVPYIQIAILILFGFILVAFFTARFQVKSHWQHFFENFHFSAEDFYTEIENGLREREIEGLEFAKESFLEKHIFSHRREYLRIRQAEYIFYVCAAPFGTGTFVSWWLCELDERILNRIPILNKLLGKDRKNKTFYQMDTEGMYKSVIHSTIMGITERLTATNGIRGLTELERQYK